MPQGTRAVGWGSRKNGERVRTAHTLPCGLRLATYLVLGVLKLDNCVKYNCINFKNEIITFLNSDFTIWSAAFISLLAFSLILLPESKIQRKIKDWYIKYRTTLSREEIEKKLGFSYLDIKQMYGNFYLDLKQTFTFNFFVLVATAIVERKISTDSLLVTYSTTSIYICLFNWKIFWDIGQKIISIAAIILGIFNIVLYIVKSYCGGDTLWLVSMMLSIFSVWLLGIKSGMIQKIKSSNS